MRGGLDRGRARRLAVAALPWAIAGLLHAILVVIAAFVAWSTIADEPNNEHIIPVMHFDEESAAPLEVEMEARLDPPATERPERPLEWREPERPIDLEAPAEPDALADLPGPAELGPFGATADDAEAFEAEFLGTRGNARRIIFCIDASGSLIDTFPHILAELERSIRGLSARQRFAVLFFQHDRVIEAGGRGLHDATTANKERVIDWIRDSENVTPGGRSNPLNAIRRALDLRPELVYLLSDNLLGSTGRHRLREELIDEIARANTSRTKINTIQFLYKDPSADAGEAGIMELIANSSGGVYRFVPARELHRR